MGNKNSQPKDEDAFFEQQLLQIQERPLLEDLDEANAALKDTQVELLRTKRDLAKLKKEFQLKENDLKDVKEQLNDATQKISELSSNGTVLLVVCGLMVLCLIIGLLADALRNRWQSDALPFVDRSSCVAERTPLVGDAPTLLLSYPMLKKVLQGNEGSPSVEAEAVWLQLTSWPARTKEVWHAIGHYLLPNPGTLLSASLYLFIVVHVIIGITLHKYYKGIFPFQKMTVIFALSSVIFLLPGIFLRNQESQAFIVLGGAYCFSATFWFEVACLLSYKWWKMRFLNPENEENTPKQEMGRIATARQKAKSVMATISVLALSKAKQFASGYLDLLRLENQIWVSFLAESPIAFRMVVEVVLVGSGVVGAKYVPFGPFALFLFSGLLLMYFEVCIAIFVTLREGEYIRLTEAVSVVVGVSLMTLGGLSSSQALGKSLIFAGNINFWHAVFLLLMQKYPQLQGPLAFLQTKKGMKALAIALLALVWLHVIVKSALEVAIFPNKGAFVALIMACLPIGSCTSMLLLWQSSRIPSAFGTEYLQRLHQQKRMELFLKKKLLWSLCIAFSLSFLLLQFLIQGYNKSLNASVEFGEVFTFSDGLMALNSFILWFGIFFLSEESGLVTEKEASSVKCYIGVVSKFTGIQILFGAAFFFTGKQVFFLHTVLSLITFQGRVLSKRLAYPTKLHVQLSYSITTTFFSLCIWLFHQDSLQVHPWIHQVEHRITLFLLNSFLCLNSVILWKFETEGKQTSQQTFLIALQPIILSIVEVSCKHRINFLFSLTVFLLDAYFFIYPHPNPPQKQKVNHQRSTSEMLREKVGFDRLASTASLLKQMINATNKDQLNITHKSNDKSHSRHSSCHSRQTSFSGDSPLASLLKARKVDSVGDLEEKSDYYSKFQPKKPINVVRIPSPSSRISASVSGRNRSRSASPLQREHFNAGRQRFFSEDEMMYSKCDKQKGDKLILKRKNANPKVILTCSPNIHKATSLQDLAESNRNSPVARQVLNEVESNRKILEIAKSKEMRPGGRKHQKVVNELLHHKSNCDQIHQQQPSK